MTLQEAEKIKELFLSKAPEDHYIIPSLMKSHNDIVNYCAHLFTGPDDFSKKIGGLLITTMLGPNSNSEITVELFIGHNSYKFLDNPELCTEIIERFIPVYRATLNHKDKQF